MSGVPQSGNTPQRQKSFRLSGGRKHAVEVKKPEAAEFAPDPKGKDGRPRTS
jgi:hypothetical protein